MLVELKLVKNPRRGKGFVYNLTDEKFVPAISAKFDRSTLVRGTYVLEEGKKYLIKEDYSTWRKKGQKYTIYIVKNNKLVQLATWYVKNGTYHLGDEEDQLKREELQQHFINYSAQLSEVQGGEVVKINAIDFAKYLIQFL